LQSNRHRALVYRLSIAARASPGASLTGSRSPR
jgi:hypothetical protein